MSFEQDYITKLNSIIHDTTIIEFINKLSLSTQKTILNELLCKEEKLENLYVFTDGGCRNNGKNNALGAYGVYFTNKTDSSYYQFNKCELLDNPTNQKAELTAIYKALVIFLENITIFHNKNIIIVTDSMYSINCITKWSNTWIKNNWKTSKGDIVKNIELIKNILDSINKLKNLANLCISFTHTFSHTSPPTDITSLDYYIWYGNNKVDKNICTLMDEYESKL